VAIGFLLFPLSPAVQITPVRVTEDYRVVKRYEAEFAISFGGIVAPIHEMPRRGLLGNRVAASKGFSASPA
jgi:hypothetical protein